MKSSPARVAVVVLGDIARSPRMMYHALSFAERGVGVDLLGTTDTRLPGRIQASETITVRRLPDRPRPSTAAPRVLYLLATGVRVLAQSLALGWQLARAPRPDEIVVQTPPALPTLPVAWLVARLRGARFIIDWHNLGSSIAALRLGDGHLVVRFLSRLEGFWGRRAYAHIAVTDAMATFLEQELGVRNVAVLYDRPPDWFKTTADERVEARNKLVPASRADGRDVAFAITSTSWSADEDFDLLLDALRGYDRESHRGALRPLHVLATGRGPGRAAFEREVQDAGLTHVTVATAWLDQDDYARALGSADLGLSLHRSASGLDLPMKVADMLGAGLPVAALDGGARWQDSYPNSPIALFESARDLSDLLTQAFADTRDARERLAARRPGPPSNRWNAAWASVAERTFTTCRPADKLRVAFLHPDLGLGGAERLIVDAAVALQERGHAVAVYTASHSEDRCFEETRDGTLDVRVRGSWLPASVLSRLRAPAAIARMTWMALCVARQRRHFDVIHVDLVAHVLPLLRFLTRRPIVFYGHYPDSLLADPRGLLRLYRVPIDALERRGLAVADLLLVNSEFTAGKFRQVGGQLPPTHVVYPSVPEHVESGEPARAREVLSLARFDEKKNVRLLLEAAALLVQPGSAELSDLTLTIAGGFDYRMPENRATLDALRELARTLGLEDVTEFHLSIDDAAKRRLLDRCACVAFTPAEEHLGIVPLEAMSAGKPVVAVRGGGVPETVSDGVTGVLCAAQPKEFAAGLARVLGNPETARAMGQAGARRVAERFSIGQFGDQLEAVLLETTDRGTRRP